MSKIDFLSLAGPAQAVGARDPPRPITARARLLGHADWPAALANHGRLLLDHRRTHHREWPQDYPALG